VTLPATDLDHILAHTAGQWEDLRGGRLFVTGGTGFVGCWLLESLVKANEALGLGAQAVVLTRHPEAFAGKAPHLAGHPAVRLIRGDVRTFEFPEGEFSHIIHAATEASARQVTEDPLGMFDTIVEGTRRTLEFARQCGARKFLLTSSGAVYGRQPHDLSHIGEAFTGGPDPADPKSVYGEGKRAAELLCTLYAARQGLECKIARCFAFVGPHLPLDIHFAVGNFIGDALANRPILVKGDGTSLRSYLYAADMAIWLWTILFKGRSCRAYNVGSERPISITDLARTVAEAVVPPAEVRVVGQSVPGRPAERYVPSTRSARTELGLEERIDLPEAVRRTLAWHRGRAARG